LESALNKLNTWCLESELYMIYEKTVYFIFKKSNDKSVVPNYNLKVGNYTLSNVEVVKYLGVHLDQNLFFDDHYKKVKNKVTHAVGVVEHLKRFSNFDTFMCYQLLIIVLRRVRCILLKNSN